MDNNNTTASNTTTSSAGASAGTGQPKNPMIDRTDLIRRETLKCLKSLTPTQLDNPETIRAAVMEACEDAIELENAIRPAKLRFAIPKELLPSQLADIIMYKHTVKRIVTGGANTKPDYDLLGIYMEDGPDKGIYSVSEETFRAIARNYDYALSSKNFYEMMLTLRDKCERVYPTRDKDLIAVNNGIFHYKMKQLMPFSPDYVFLSKSRIDYNPNAKNVTIHNPDGTDWDVESWMKTLQDSPDVVNLLWEILGAIIRPNVPWGKAVWFYSETGCNGKGTLCELMRQLCGDGTYAVIPLADMGKDFHLEPLMSVSAIIVDENDVGTYIDKAANIKAIITGDPILINRKYRSPISVRFRGLMTQCVNELPRVKDKSNSFFRRQLFIPFTKCFTGVEKPYIKNDYLHRKEVLEYVLFRVLNMNYYTLSEPEECKAALDAYREYNDPVRQFAKEILPQLKWTSIVPFSFLHDLFKAWYAKNVGEGRVQSKQTFLKDFKNIVSKEYPEWEFPDKPVRSGNCFDTPEPLILEYNLTEWMNSYAGTTRNPEKICTFNHPKELYRGMTKH